MQIELYYYMILAIKMVIFINQMENMSYTLVKNRDLIYVISGTPARGIVVHLMEYMNIMLIVINRQNSINRKRITISWCDTLDFTEDNLGIFGGIRDGDKEL